jgi:hypothetical protein
MVASGYLLQTAVDDAWRAVWLWIHLVTSGLWIVGYLVHQVPTVRLWMQRGRKEEAQDSDVISSVEEAKAARRSHRSSRSRS